MQRLFDEINGDGEERVMGKKGQFIKEQRSFQRELHLERPSSELQDNKSLPSTSSRRQRKKIIIHEQYPLCMNDSAIDKR